MELWERSWCTGEEGRVWLGVLTPEEVGVAKEEDLMVETCIPESIF